MPATPISPYANPATSIPALVALLGKIMESLESLSDAPDNDPETPAAEPMLGAAEVATLRSSPDGQLSVEVDADPLRHSVWMTVRPGIVTTLTPTTDWPAAEYSQHVTDVLTHTSTALAPGQKTLELAAIGMTPDGDIDWDTIVRTFHPFEILAPAKGKAPVPTPARVEVTGQAAHTLLRSKMTVAKQRRFIGNAGKDLVIEDQLFALPSGYRHENSKDKRDLASVFFAYGYRSVTLRRCLFVGQRYGGSVHNEWRHASLSTFNCGRVTIEDCATDGGFIGLRTYQCESVVHRRCRHEHYARHAWQDMQLRQNDALPQSVHEDFHLDQQAPSASRVSADHWNLYASHGTARKPIIVRRGFIGPGSRGQNGSGFVLFDANGSYQHAADIAMVDMVNKGWAYAGGHHGLAERIWSAQEDKRLATEHGMAGYLGDYVTPHDNGKSNGTDANFGAFEAIDCRANYTRPSGKRMGWLDFTAGLVNKQGKRIFAKQPGVKVAMTNCNFADASLSNREVIERGQLLSAAAVRVVQ